MKKVTFPARGDFNKTLKARVDRYFAENRLNKTGDWRMFLKSALILAWLVTSYVLLVFFSGSLLMAILTVFALAQGFVLVGFNIMHDGNHGSYSRNKTVNRLMGLTMDLIGGSSMLWRQKHNILHHTYTNVHELDDDLDTGGLIRLSPSQDWRPWHRFQHWYAFPLYSFLTLSWMTFSDFQKIFTGRIGQYPLRKPSKRELFFFFLTKFFYFGYMLILPMFFHPVLYVLLGFLGVHIVLGFTLSIVFQLAHTVQGNAFPEPTEPTGVIENEWAIHQVETTANFATKNKLVTWYLGGLNFQIEHHLFAKICHIHYPAISEIVQKTCREFSIPYMNHPTVRQAVVAHLRFLRDMSQPPQLVPA